MPKFLRRKVASLSLLFLVAQIVMPGLAYAANPSLDATLTQANVPAGAQIATVSIPHDVGPGDNLVFTLSGTTINQAFDTTSAVTLGLLNVKIGALVPFVTSTVDTATRTFTLTSANPGVSFPVPTLELQSSPNSFSTLVNNVVAVAQQAEFQVSANLIAGDTLGITVAGTGVIQNFTTDKNTTLTALASQITSNTIVNATFSGATDKIYLVAKTPGVAFSLSNVVIQSSSVAPTTVQPNVVPVAQVDSITLPRTIDPGEQLSITVAGTTITQSYTGSSNATLDGLTVQIDALAAVDAVRVGSVITVTASVPGTPFSIGSLSVTGGSVSVTHVAPNIVAVAQQDAMTFGRDFVVGDSLSGSVNGTLVNVSYSGSSAGTLAALASAIDALPGVSATSNAGLKTVTVTAEAAGTPFTLGTFAISTQVTDSSIVANVIAKAQSETVTFSRNLVAGDTASIVINGTTVTQAYTGSSNATITALASAISGLSGVSASANTGTRTITVDASTAGVSFSISTLSLINQSAPTVIQNPANAVKQVSSYVIPNTFVAGDSIDWKINGQSLTGAFNTDDSTTLSDIASTTDALGAVDATNGTGRTVTVTAATAGVSFTAGNLTTTSSGVAPVQNVANQAETKASLTLTLNSVPAEGETATIGSCGVTFSTGAADYDCSDNTATVSIASGDVATVAALLRGLSGISDPVNGVLSSSGNGATAIFTRSTTQVGTTQVNFVDGTAGGTITSSLSTPVEAVAQSETYTMPRALVSGDTVTVTIGGTVFTQTFLSDSNTTVSNLASNIDSLPQFVATASGSTFTVTASAAGTSFTTGNLVVTNVSVPMQSISSSAGAVAIQAVTFPTAFVAGDTVSVTVNGTGVTTPFATDNTTTLLNIASNISAQPGISATASGSDTVVISSTSTGASLVVGNAQVTNDTTPVVIQANVAPVAQVDDFGLPYDLSGQTVTATISGSTLTQSFTTDTATTMTLLGGQIDGGPLANASYSGSTKTLTLTAKTAGTGFSGAIRIDGETVSPINLVPNTASGAQIDDLVLNRNLVAGETLSVTVDGTGVTVPFATDTATTLASLATAIDALSGVSAVSDAPSKTVTVTAETAGIPFTISALAIDMSVSDTPVTANVPAQTQIMQVTVPRNLVAGDVLTLPVGTGGTNVTATFSGSEALTMSGFAAAIDALPGVAATASGLVVTVSAEVAGIPFTLGNLSLTNTVVPTTTVNNVSPVAQVESVAVPTFYAGDSVSVTVNATTVTVPFSTDSATTLANLRSGIDAIGAVTTSMSGSSMILTANVPGTPFSVTTLTVDNTQTGSIIVVNVPPVSQIVTVSASNTTKKWTFRVTVNGTNYDYLSNALDTDSSIATALAGVVTASGVTATASGGNLLLTASVPGTAFTYATVALDLTAPAIADVATANETLRSGATTATSLSLDEDGSIYFVQSGSNVMTSGQLTTLLGNGQAFLGKANAVSGIGYTFTIPGGVQDGGYNAIAIDAAGNISGEHTTGLVVDNTPPLLTIATASGQTVNSANFTISGSTEASLSVNIANTGSTTSVTALGNGDFSGTVALQPNMLNTISVTATDVAGNTTTKIVTVTQDNINPIVSVTTAAAVTKQASVAFSGTTEANSTVAITGGAATVNTVADGNGDFSGTVSLTPNALNNLLVTATDAAGNVGTGSANVLQDSINPTVVLSTASGAIVDANNFQVDGTTEANASLVIMNQSGSTVSSGTASSTGSFSLSPTLDQDTVNVLSVTATDAAGNTSASALTVTEDSVPNSLLISPIPAATSAANVTLTGSTKAGSSVVLVRGGLTLTGSAAAGTYSFNVPLVANSSNTLNVTSTDAAGHVATGSVSIVQDNINPTVSITTPAQTTNATSITVDGTTEAFASVVVSGGSGSSVGGVADGSGAFSLVVPLTIGASSSLLVTATDIAGNVGTGSVVIVQDPVPLTLAISPSGPLYLNTASFVLTGTSKPGANIDVTGSATGSTVVTGSGAFSVTLPLATNATNNFLVTATDATATVLTGSITVIQDSIAPTVSVSATGALTNAMTYILTGSTETGATVNATYSTGSVSTIASGTGAYSITLPLAANASRTFTIDATDLAGNVSSGTTVTVAQDGAAPVVGTQSFSGTTVGSVTTGYYAFTTNETTTATFYLGTGSNVLATLVWSGSTNGMNHSGSIVGVQPNATYYEYVHAVDLAGNVTDTSVSSMTFAAPSVTPGGSGGGGTPVAVSAGAPIPAAAGGGYVAVVPKPSSNPTSHTGSTSGAIRTPNLPSLTRKPASKPIIPRKPILGRPENDANKPTPIGRAVDTDHFGYDVINQGVPTNVADTSTNPVDYQFHGGARFISAANSVNIRSTAGTNGTLIAVLPRNSRVELVGTSGKWGQVSFDGVTGWVSLDYLRTLQDSDIARNDPFLFDTTREHGYVINWGIVNAERYLNMRYRPDASSGVVRSLPRGEVVVILDHLDYGWVEIRTERGTGYVQEKFLK